MPRTTNFIRQFRHGYRDVQGELGYFGLGSWWSSVFSKKEQNYMEACFAAVTPGVVSRSLTRGRSSSSYPAAAALLISLADSLQNGPEDRPLAIKVLAEAEQRARTEGDVIGLHLVYQGMIRLYSRWRDHYGDSLNLTFGACHKQVAMATLVAGTLAETYPGKPLPMHLGYQKMVSLLELEGSYSKAIEICKQARDQGWNGNWTYIIGTLAKKRDEKDYGQTHISGSGMRPL